MAASLLFALAVGCTAPQPRQTLTIPRPLFEQASKRAKLVELLQESIRDDAKGIVNKKREKLIKKLLKDVRPDQ